MYTGSYTSNLFFSPPVSRVGIVDADGLFSQNGSHMKILEPRKVLGKKH